MSSPRSEGAAAAAFEAGLASRLSSGGSPAETQAAAAAEALAQVAPGSLAAALFFGSRRTQARPDTHSAYDLFLVAYAARPFYAALHQAGLLHRPPALLAAVGACLPPSQVALPLELAGTRVLVKASVLSVAQLESETSQRRHDHFCVARLFQPLSLVYAADAVAHRSAVAAVAGAQRATLDWLRPSLPESFAAEDYARLALEVSLRAEVRPEGQGRAAELWQAQRDELVPAYAALLEERAAAGELRALAGGRYALALAPTPEEQAEVARYFRRSRRRATARWAKHVVTFEGWLDYIALKVERHTGRRVELSPRERRWPFIFLWPRLLRFLRQRRTPPRPSGGPEGGE